MLSIRRIVMTRPIVLAIWLGVAVVPCHGQSNDNTQRKSVALKATLSLPRKTFVAGEAIPATIVLTNIGSSPELIENRIIRTYDNDISYIQFSLKDAQGREIQETRYSYDSFGRVTGPSLAVALIRNLLLLYPDYSLSTVFPIDPKLFAGIRKPGRYTLFADYSSNGLSYSAALGWIGVSETDAKKLPFPAWTGKVRTNSVSFRIIQSHPAPSKK